MKSSAMLFVLAGVLCSTPPAGASQAAGGGSELDGQVEEIYIGRNIRESRNTSPTEFCAQTQTGFAATLEDRYTLRSIATRAVDGRMIDTNAAIIGRFHVCIGTTPNATLNVYVNGTLGRIPLTAAGDCQAPKQNYPEPGIQVFACAFDVRDLPTGYVGGLITTNTVASRNAGEKSDPAGYVQTSIVTVRLWRRR
jgi:hypothetical protein